MDVLRSVHWAVDANEAPILTVARPTSGGQKLEYEGFIYRHQKQIKEGRRWKCDAANKGFKFQGRLVAENDGDSPEIIGAGGHAHSANPFLAASPRRCLGAGGKSACGADGGGAPRRF